MEKKTLPNRSTQVESVNLLEHDEVIQLTYEESEQVLAALLNPPEPNEALRKLMRC